MIQPNSYVPKLKLLLSPNLHFLQPASYSHCSSGCLVVCYIGDTGSSRTLFHLSLCSSSVSPASKKAYSCSLVFFFFLTALSLECHKEVRTPLCIPWCMPRSADSWVIGVCFLSLLWRALCISCSKLKILVIRCKVLSCSVFQHRSTALPWVYYFSIINHS